MNLHDLTPQEEQPLMAYLRKKYGPYTWKQDAKGVVTFHMTALDPENFETLNEEMIELYRQDAAMWAHNESA